MSAALRIYRALLVAYPAGFRQRFGVDMERAFRDRYVAAARRGRGHTAALLARTFLDVVANATALRIRPRMNTDTHG